MTKQIQNAIAKAKQIKCAVKLFGQRAYLITNPKGRTYKVTFHMHEGQRYGYCNCAAGSRNVPCYHLIPAAIVDTAIQNMRAR